jgi:hypothetical protein
MSYFIDKKIFKIQNLITIFYSSLFSDFLPQSQAHTQAHEQPDYLILYFGHRDYAFHIYYLMPQMHIFISIQLKTIMTEMKIFSY